MLGEDSRRIVLRLQRVEQVLGHTLVYLRDQARRDKELEWDRVQALLEDLRETSK